VYILYFQPTLNEGSYYEPSNLEPSENIPFQTPPKVPELDKNITKPFTASPSCKKKSPKALSEIALEIEGILKAECDARGITWEYAKERKNIEYLVSLKRDRGECLSLVDKFIELTRAPSGFLSRKPPTALMLKVALSTVEAALSNSSEHQQLLRKAAQSFTCPKCGSQIIQGDIACPECGTLVQDIDGVTT
jgi:predicted RNA-binding Zn-ribbon protein involved in translation (DUF1610 family)